jgi:hypothetical protein
MFATETPAGGVAFAHGGYGSKTGVAQKMLRSDRCVKLARRWVEETDNEAEG